MPENPDPGDALEANETGNMKAEISRIQSSLDKPEPYGPVKGCPGCVDMVQRYLGMRMSARVRRFALEQARDRIAAAQAAMVRECKAVVAEIDLWTGQKGN